MDKKQAQRLDANAYWQRVAEIGQQETQMAKMAKKQTTTPEHTQKRKTRQTQ